MPEPSDSHLTSDDQKPAAAAKTRRRIAAVLFILTVVTVTLAFFTVHFTLKTPIIRVHKLTYNDFDLFNGSNVTLNAVVSVKNPNLASVTYGDMTTTFYYRGAVVGDMRGPAGRVEARRTVRVNVTVGIMKDRVLTRPGLEMDIHSGLVNVSSYTRVWWRVNVFVFGKEMRVKMKCDVRFNITSRAIQGHKCNRNVRF